MGHPEKAGGASAAPTMQEGQECGVNPGTVTLCRIFLAPTTARNDGIFGGGRSFAALEDDKLKREANAPRSPVKDGTNMGHPEKAGGASAAPTSREGQEWGGILRYVLG